MVAATWISGIVTIHAHVVPHLDKQPMHTSVLSGQRWVQELLEGNFNLNSFLGLHYFCWTTAIRWSQTSSGAMTILNALSQPNPDIARKSLTATYSFLSCSRVQGNVTTVQRKESQRWHPEVQQLCQLSANLGPQTSKRLFGINPCNTVPAAIACHLATFLLFYQAFNENCIVSWVPAGMGARRGILVLFTRCHAHNIWLARLMQSKEARKCWRIDVLWQRGRPWPKVTEWEFGWVCTPNLLFWLGFVFGRGTGL